MDLFDLLLAHLCPSVILAHGAQTRRDLARRLGIDLPELPSGPGEWAVATATLAGRPVRICLIPSLAPPAWNRWSSWAPACFRELVPRVAAWLKEPASCLPGEVDTGGEAGVPSRGQRCTAGEECGRRAPKEVMASAEAAGTPAPAPGEAFRMGEKDVPERVVIDEDWIDNFLASQNPPVIVKMPKKSMARSARSAAPSAQPVDTPAPAREPKPEFLEAALHRWFVVFGSGTQTSRSSFALPAMPKTRFCKLEDSRGGYLLSLMTQNFGVEEGRLSTELRRRGIASELKRNGRYLSVPVAGLEQARQVLQAFMDCIPERLRVQID